MNTEKMILAYIKKMLRDNKLTELRVQIDTMLLLIEKLPYESDQQAAVEAIVSVEEEEEKW